MSKKNKNIIAIVVMVFLIVCLLVTFHFAKNDYYDREDEKYPVRENNFKLEKDIHSNNSVIEDDEELPDEENEEGYYVEVNEALDSSKDSYVTSEGKEGPESESTYKYDMPSRSDIYDEKTYISLCYAILICFESILLGGTIMYLILNNWDIINKSSKGKK